MTELSNLDSVSADRNSKLLTQLDLLHTTELGEERIRRNLDLPLEADVVQTCRELIIRSDKIERRGKNWYATCGNAVLTVNAGSLTIITGRQEK